MGQNLKAPANKRPGVAQFSFFLTLP